MGPTTAVALPHRTVMTIRPISWVRATRLPRAVAVSLPRLRLFSARLSSRAAIPATTTGSRTIFSVCRVRISSEPACQKRADRRRPGLSRGDAVGQPLEYRRKGDPGESEAHRAQLTAALAAGKGYQQRGAERAAERQQQAASCGEVIPNSAAPRTMAKLAPELTPSRPGSASGLRVSVCISAPASRGRRRPADRPECAAGARPAR